MTQWKIPTDLPKSPRNTSDTAKSDCPVCHGTGWDFYKSYEGSLEVYGEQKLIEYARRCTRCNGRNENSIDETEVPENMRSVDISKVKWDIYGVDVNSLRGLCYSFCNEFETWENNLKGIYFYSKTPGSGKTFISCCLAKSVMIRTSRRVKFITAIDYLKKVQESFKQDRGELDPSWVYRNCDLLVLDDIGAQKNSEWQEQEIFRLINERLTKNLLTIYTSNFIIDKLPLLERTKDRIRSTTVSIPLPEISVRSMKANKEQNAFIRKMIGGQNETNNSDMR